MNLIEHKDYHGKVEYSVEDGVLHGRILGINDLVTFEADAASEVEGSFQEAVEDYIATCKELGKEPEKEFKGQLNVRIEPRLHKWASMAAASRNISINRFFGSAMTYLYQSPNLVDEIFHMAEQVKDKSTVKRASKRVGGKAVKARAKKVEGKEHPML